MTRAEWTEAQIRHVAWQASLGVDAETLSTALRVHSPSSVFLLVGNMIGRMPNASSLALQIAAELDQEPRYIGWRDDLDHWYRHQSF